MDTKAVEKVVATLRQCARMEECTGCYLQGYGMDRCTRMLPERAGHWMMKLGVNGSEEDRERIDCLHCLYEGRRGRVCRECKYCSEDGLDCLWDGLYREAADRLEEKMAGVV